MNTHDSREAGARGGSAAQQPGRRPLRIDRRSMLKGALAGGAAAVATAVAPAPAFARARREPGPDDVGLLYDATLCIGCKACVVACREANYGKPESSTGLWDDPLDLSGDTRNV